jgi:hypothetical protein
MVHLPVQFFQFEDNGIIQACGFRLLAVHVPFEAYLPALDLQVNQS